VDALVEAGKLLAVFLFGLSQNIGACARPAGEFVTEKQRTTVAVPVEVGINPPQCS
jgi:hypothetical protein